MAVDPGERVDLPSGDALFYVDDSHPDPKMRHSYWRCKDDGKRGTRLTGVTTITKVLDYDPSRLLSWAAKTQCIGIAELVGPYLFGEGDLEELAWLASQESIWRELESAKLTFEQIRDRAAEEGTNVHRAALQALAMGKPVPDYDGLTDRERGLTQAVAAFWLDHDPSPEQVEQIVYSKRLGVAGRLDLRGTLSTCGNPGCACHDIDPGIGVLDLKTGNYLSAAAHEQVGGGYPLLAAESKFGLSSWALILKVRDDGTYELIPAQGTPSGFEASVTTYREAARINREAAKDYKARKAAREVVPA